MIAQSSIDELLERADVVSTVESYLELKKAGVNWKAQCPFHDEKSASFVVSPQKQIFHCFGCGKGGNAITFVKEMERLTYPEAIEKLAADNNYTLQYEGGGRAEIVSNDVLEGYRKWCQTLLKSNVKAMEYLRGRGLTDKSIEDFEIGYSPKSADVINFVKSNMYNMADAIKLDVIREGDSGLYSAFTERIMFPIRNASGKLCGFSGRTLIGHKAKYLNTKDTVLFDKSSILFGYDQAKEFISKKGVAIITEGQLDVVMMHQAGFTNTVASMGTALTKRHIPMLSRVCKKTTLMYDGDRAGVEAAFKATTILLQAQVEVGVSMVPDGMDPADLISEGKVSEVNVLIDRQKDGVIFAADRIFLKYDMNNPFQKQEALADTNSFASILSLFVKEKFQSYAASVIGYIEPVVYRPTVDRNRTAWEVAQLSIIKTMMNNNDKTHIESLKEIVNCFTYSSAVQSIIDGTMTDDIIGKIYLDDTIPLLDSLEKGLISFKITCMKKWIDRTRVSNKMQPAMKIQKIREAQYKLKVLEDKFKEIEYGGE